MHVKMRVNTENYFALFRQMNHPVLLLRRDALPTRSQDRTLTVQNKAPIRSQTSGPATRGERRAAVDKSTPRHVGQSQHESGWAGRSPPSYIECPSNSLCDSCSGESHVS